MDKNRHRIRPAAKLQLLFTASALVVLYLVFTWTLYQDETLRSTVEDLPVSESFIEYEQKLAAFRSPAFFRLIAERQQYYAHEPAGLSQLYRLALLRGPADHATFASYAAYLGSRGCCKEQAIKAWDEAIRRCPTYAKVRLVAASGYFTYGEKKKALSHLRAAIELDSSLAQRAYDLCVKTGLQISELIALTPSTPAAQMQLAEYLMKKGERGASFNGVLQKLGTMALTGPQRIDLIRYALNVEHYDIAAAQARIASAREDTRSEGLSFLAEVAWKQNDLVQFERFAAQAEQSYLDRREIDRAAKSALDASSRLISREDKKNAARRLESLLNRYPKHAPAFHQMALFHQNNPERQLYYLEKAAALDPVPYQKDLAGVYYRAGKFAEAEEIYRRLVAAPENHIDAYLGWARCRIAQGNPLGATDVLKTAIEKTGGAPALILQLGEAYDSFGDYQNAALTYQAYSRSAPNQIEGYLRAAEVYMKIAQYWKAREQYAKILEHDPNNAEAREKLAYLDSLGY